MFILKYAQKNAEVTEIEDRLKQMSLSFKLEKREDLSEIILEEDKTRFSGFKSINDHLDQLSGELNSWYYCNC